MINAHMKLREVVDTQHDYRLGIDSAREPAPGKVRNPGRATITAAWEVTRLTGITRLSDYSPTGRIKFGQASLIKMAMASVLIAWYENNGERVWALAPHP